MIKEEIESAIRDLPDNCRPDAPEDLTLPLCEHRAYGALCRAIESLKAKSLLADAPNNQFLFLPSEVFTEIQELYCLELVREIIVTLADHFGIPACDCGARDEETGEEIDPYICGGVFCKILDEVFSCPATN